MKKTFDDELLEKFSPEYMMGLDEVGRGPLAGPVVACCVSFFVKDFDLIKMALIKLGVTDSKKIKAKKRQLILAALGIDYSTLKSGTIYQGGIDGAKFTFSIDESSPHEIDQINILQASLLSMKRSLLKIWKEKKLAPKKILALIDGNKKFQWPSNFEGNVELQTVVGGDAKSLVIGLASIIAKEYRDHLMVSLHQIYPNYGLDKNAGYPTEVHRKAIELFGVTDVHRKSFRGVKEFVEMGERA